MQEMRRSNEGDRDEFNKRNETFAFLNEKLIQPLLKEETDLNILKTINENLGDEDNCNKLFCTSMNYFSKDSPLLTYENCEKYFQIFEKLIIIFYKKKNFMFYKEELERTLKTLFSVVKNSKTKKQVYMGYGDDKEESNESESKEGIIFAYKLLYKLSKEYEHILKALVDGSIIDTLITKISDHIKPIRELIYDTLLYTIKQTDEYNNKAFDLLEGETDGGIRLSYTSIYSRNNVNSEQTLKLLEERPELLKILLVIISQNNESNISEIDRFIEQIFDKYEDNPEKIYNLIDIMSALIQINDHYTYERFIKWFGYSSLVCIPIPKDEEESNNQNYNDSSSSNSNSDNESEKNKIKEKEENKKKKNQKWPLFGERLIDGDINKEIYEYTLSDHNKIRRCLLAILFPSKHRLEEDQEENNNNAYSNYGNKNKIIKLPEENRKKILLSFMRSIFGERNNYPLFKYLYLIPSRSLLYRNLYSEIIAKLEFWEKNPLICPLDKMKKKEEEYKNFVEKEVKMVLEAVVEKDKEKNSYMQYYRRDSDDINFDDDIYDDKFFECKDKRMKSFTGFIGEIIPGQVIREEIHGIAKSAGLAMYRIHYYTKYYQLDELRDRLLHPEKY